MTGSMKLGITSALLVAGCVLPSPLNAVFAVISCVLAFIAAHRGSRWWLVLPCTIIAVAGFLLYFGFHAA